MKTKKWEMSDILMIAGVTILSMIIRYEVRDFVSGDWNYYWKHWFDGLYSQGLGFLGTNGYDYAPPFVCMMYLVTLFPVDSMYGFKIMVSIIDLVAAVIALKLTYSLTENRAKSVLMYAFFMLCPVYIVNSTLWAQCDMLPMLWVLLCMYYLVKERPNLAMFFYGVAFAFKMQPVWILPMLLILWVNKKIRFQHFLWIPVCYLVGILPAWIAGRPLLDCIGIYFGQTTLELYTLGLKYPNVFYLIGTGNFLLEYHTASMILAFGIFMIVLYYIGRKRLIITPKFMLLLGGFVGILAPFFLPHMHERYSFFAEVLLVFYAFMEPKKFYIPLLQMLTSFVGYSVYLSQNWELPLTYMAPVNLFVLINVGYLVYRYINDPANQLEVKPC